MPIGQCNPHQSTLPSHQSTPTTLFFMSSMTFFESSSDCKNTKQFWEGASSAPSLQSPRREHYPSTCPVFARLDTPTPQGPACKGVPQTCCPQCQAPINVRADLGGHLKYSQRLVWSSCWGATGSAGRSTQRGEQRRVVRTRGNKGEVGVTRDQCRVW